jgi:hypothetical protein
MNLRAVRALLRKDAALFAGNRFYLLITVLGIIFYAGIYFALPAQADENLNLGMYAPVLPPAFTELTGHEGVKVDFLASPEALRQAVLNGDYEAGVALPPDILEIWARGGKPSITVYASSSVPPEVSATIILLVKELSFAQTGRPLDYETTEETLGPDLLGDQIALRDRMRPLLAVFTLLLEIMTLASLIAVEIEQGTARALLVTPVRVSELFAAKGLLGIILALGQAALFMALVGGFGHQPLIILLTLLLGSILVVSLGFLLAALTRDVMSVTGWGILVLIFLAIPGFGVAVPGLMSDWVKAIPSYYLTDTVNRVANYGAGWGEVGLNLLMLAVITTLAAGLGMAVLRRRYR